VVERNFLCKAVKAIFEIDSSLILNVPVCDSGGRKKTHQLYSGTKCGMKHILHWHSIRLHLEILYKKIFNQSIIYLTNQALFIIPMFSI
jgi:hypothetical protein